ncbi:MAG: cytochrome-c peroxidase [Planctomycetes bacterium]|nr:cytochrome-c peroxidase [Planctomycetota bacterium]
MGSFWWVGPIPRARWIGVLALFMFSMAPQEPPGVPEDTLPENLPGEAPLGLLRIENVDPAELVQLGRMLFFDPVLSRDRTIACASCHRPESGFADNKALSFGVGGKQTLRNAPSLFNRAYGRSFMWDGRSKTLEEQVLLPIENKLEMDLPLDQAVERLRSEERYAKLFEANFNRLADRQGLALALASFVRRIFSADSPVDQFRAGDRQALSPAARSGLWLYESRGGCWRCHTGANFSDEKFHNTGVGVRDGVPEEGRFQVTLKEEERGAFKTPTLRGVATTAPYMHDGSLRTLEEVVEFYRAGGNTNENLDRSIAPIQMSDGDALNLVAFLRALSE